MLKRECCCLVDCSLLSVQQVRSEHFHVPLHKPLTLPRLYMIGVPASHLLVNLDSICIRKPKFHGLRIYLLPSQALQVLVSLCEITLFCFLQDPVR